MKNSTTNKPLSTSVANDDVKASAKPSLLANLNRWIKVSGITRSLYQLDDRTLNDIGVTRGEIRKYAEKLVNQDNQHAA